MRTVITRGNTIQTKNLSKSIRNQLIAHSNLAANKNIPCRNNVFNPKIEKQQKQQEKPRFPPHDDQETQTSHRFVQWTHDPKDTT